MFRRRPDCHPFAIPPAPGGQGVYLAGKTPNDPLGYVRKRAKFGPRLYDTYTQCRYASGKRPRLTTFCTFNSAVA